MASNPYVGAFFICKSFKIQKFLMVCINGSLIFDAQNSTRNVH